MPSFHASLTDINLRDQNLYSSGRRKRSSFALLRSTGSIKPSYTISCWASPQQRTHIDDASFLQTTIHQIPRLIARVSTSLTWHPGCGRIMESHGSFPMGEERRQYNQPEFELRSHSGRGSILSWQNTMVSGESIVHCRCVAYLINQTPGRNSATAWR